MTIFAGVGGGLTKLAPDLSFPSDRAVGQEYIEVTGIDCSSGLTTVLSLTGGKFAIPFVRMVNMTNESVTIKLTIDGVVIYNDTFVLGTTSYQVIGNADASPNDILIIQCDSTFLLECNTTADTSIDLRYIAKPIF